MNLIEAVKELDTVDFKHGTGVAPLDFTINMETPMDLPAGQSIKLQVLSVSVSNLIPNIYNGAPYVEWNNTVVKVVFMPANVGVTVILPRGIYWTAEAIGAAINSALRDNPISSVFLVDNPNPVRLITNTVTMQIGLTIDTMGLPPGVSMTLYLIDDLATTLGFAETTFQSTPGPGEITYVSTLLPQLDVQGVEIDVQATCVAPRRRNGGTARTLCIIPFANNTGTSDIQWPGSAGISPVMYYDGPRMLRSVTLTIKTKRGDVMLFMGGGIHVVIGFFRGD